MNKNMQSYKDELLQDKIDDMDDLDKIQLQNKAIYKETVMNGISLDFNSSRTTTWIFLGFSAILIATVSNLQKYGFDYFTHLLFVKIFMFISLVGIITQFCYLLKLSKIKKQLDEDIDEFIRENAD